jgi:hypothetical protein
LSTQRHIEALRKTVRQIKDWRAMLEASAAPERRDRELRRRLAENASEESVMLEELARFGVFPDETTA